MAKEIIDNTERFILVQIDKEGIGRVAYQDFTGSFTTPKMVNHVQGFKSEENTKKVTETSNLLYQLANKKQRVKVAKEVVEGSNSSPEVTVNTETV